MSAENPTNAELASGLEYQASKNDQPVFWLAAARLKEDEVLIARLRAALRPFAACKTTSTGDRDACHWQCLVSAQHLSDARDALGIR